MHAGVGCPLWYALQGRKRCSASTASSAARNGFDKHSDKLAENFEVPLEAAEDLRKLFEGLPEVFPYFFDEFQISTLEQMVALQRWCPEKHLKLEEVDYFIGVSEV